MTRGQLLAAALVEVGLAAASGAAAACGVAVAASPLMPIGPARLAEPDPGVSVNAAVLAAGFAAITVLLLARVAWPAWRQASARLSAEHDAAGTQGQDWDIAVDLQFSTITPQRFDGLAARVPGISGWTFGFHGALGIGNAVVPAIGLAAGRGPLLSPTLLAGRAPQADNEVVLGSSVLRSLGLRVGQSVPVTAGGHRELARIVGRAVFPFFGEGSFTVTTLTGLALLVGLPLGVAGGHWAWDLFAGNVGLATDAVTPLTLLWTIPATLAVAILIALRPGQLVARLNPAAVLRTE
jgi:hypothetical protein